MDQAQTGDRPTAAEADLDALLRKRIALAVRTSSPKA